MGILAELDGVIAAAKRLPLAERIEFLNAARRLLHDALSPFSGEPVDCVLWVPASKVVANDYNPNRVAPPEMSLLRLSIEADGYTQPIVTAAENGRNVVVDGFHRHRVGQEAEAIAERLGGYLPVVTIKPDREGRADRIASTIRHNRARGKHAVEGMSQIVVELTRRNWSEARIGRELGMEPDEVRRLKQITGLAELFAGEEYSEAWEPAR